MGKKPAPTWTWALFGAFIFVTGVVSAVKAPRPAPELSTLQRIEGAVTAVTQRPSHRTRTAKHGVSISEGSWDITLVAGDDARSFDLGHLSGDQIRRTHALTRERHVVALHDGASVWQLETPSSIALSYPVRKANVDAERKTNLAAAALVALLGLVFIGVGSMQALRSPAA
jgi:hypothetical protein